MCIAFVIPKDWCCCTPNSIAGSDSRKRGRSNSISVHAVESGNYVIIKTFQARATLNEMKAIVEAFSGIPAKPNKNQSR